MKLDRAKLHREELARRVKEFEESNPYSVTFDVDVHRGFYEQIAHFRGDPSFHGYAGLVVGDIVNNLRSSLDYIAYNLTIIETRKDPPTGEKQIQFPIVKTAKPADWQSERKK